MVGAGIKSVVRALRVCQYVVAAWMYQTSGAIIQVAREAYVALFEVRVENKIFSQFVRSCIEHKGSSLGDMYRRLKAIGILQKRRGSPVVFYHRTNNRGIEVNRLRRFAQRNVLTGVYGDLALSGN
ncbi:MAG: hypothetical protein DYG98_27815 [Haliscomenobacteraceae bacterium CHB4]|nr:hypothetical protein [Haliscomenobacteraceae bacterium CHB4]